MSHSRNTLNKLLKENDVSMSQTERRLLGWNCCKNGLPCVKLKPLKTFVIWFDRKHLLGCLINSINDQVS